MRLVNNALRWVLIPVLILFILSVSASAAVNYDDTWTYSYSTISDGVVWGGYNLDTYATGYSSYADCLCWDWNDDGSADNTIANWNTCWCKSSGVQSDCETYSAIVNNVCNVLNDCGIDSDLGADHNVATGSSGDRSQIYIDAREYRDCDDSSGQRATADHSWDAHQVIYPKKYECDGEAYDTKGAYNATNWKTWDQDRSCGAYTRCDTNSGHNNYDNQEVTTANGTIPNPCSTRDGSISGFACTDDDDCYSGNCGGSRITYDPICDADQSNGYTLDNYTYSNTCGGTGYQSNSGSESKTCSADLGTDYVCDSDLDEVNTTNPSDFCKLLPGRACTWDTDCWNNNGGYDCNSGYCSKCGDYSCDGAETYSNCPTDCCFSDCTGVINGEVSDDTCHQGCDGQWGIDSAYCWFATSSTKTACDGQGKNAVVCVDSDTYVTCCTGSATDCSSGYTCEAGACVVQNETDLEIVDVIPIQVIPDVDMVKDKSGYVRVIVRNNGPLNATALVNVTFEGTLLVPYNPTNASMYITDGTNATFDFEFKPDVSGINKQIIANVSVV